MTPRRALVDSAPLVALVAICSALLWVYDVPGLHVLRYLAYLTLVIVLPGAAVWRWVMGRHDARNPETAYPTWLEDLACGAALGYLIEIAAYAAFRAAGAPRWYVVVPLLLLLLWIRDPGPSRRPLGRSAWALVLLGGYVTFWLLRQTLSALPVGERGVFTEPDEMYHLALVGELRHHLPAVYPYLDSQQLEYQYFVHLHTAASSWATGLEATELYRRFDPVVMTVIAVLGVACLAARLTRNAWSGWLAAAILVLVGSFDISGLVPGEAAVEERFLMGDVLVHSPTQTLAYVLAAPLFIMAAELVTAERRLPWTSWALFGALALGMAGSKVTYPPMLACGLVAVAVLSRWLTRADWRRAVGGVAVVGAGLAASYVVLFGGQASRGVEFSPFAIGDLYGPVFGGVDTFEKAALVTAAMLAMWLVPAVGAVGLLIVPVTRTDPRVWLLGVSAAAGYGASALLVHQVGHSERYFERSAATLTAVLCAWGLTALMEGRGTVRRSAVVAVASGLTLFGVRLAMESLADVERSATGSFRVPAVPVVLNLFIVVLAALVVATVAVAFRRQRLPVVLILSAVVGLGLARTMSFVLGNTDPPDLTVARIPDDGIEAAEHLREHADPDDRVMTNAHCGPLSSSRPCDSRHFWMSAMSERRFVIEGWGYIGDAGWHEPFRDADLLAANDEAFASPAALKRFAAAHSIDWAFIDRSQLRGALLPTTYPGIRMVVAGEQHVLLDLRATG